MAVQSGKGPGRNDSSGAKGQKQRSSKTAPPKGSRVEPSHVSGKKQDEAKAVATKKASKKSSEAASKR